MTPIITYTCLPISFWNNLWINYSVSFPNNPLQFSYVIGFTIVFISNTCQQYSLSLFLFLSSLQLLIHQFCSASVCLCCLSTFPLIRVTNIYWTLILCQTLCCVRDAKKKKKNDEIVFPQRVHYFIATILVQASVTSGLSYDHSWVFCLQFLPTS